MKCRACLGAAPLTAVSSGEAENIRILWQATAQLQPQRYVHEGLEEIKEADSMTGILKEEISKHKEKALLGFETLCAVCFGQVSDADGGLLEHRADCRY